LQKYFRVETTLASAIVLSRGARANIRGCIFMKTIVSSLIFVALILTACAPAEERARTKALYDKYDDHCIEHAEKTVGSPDVESLYRECMNYFVGTDVHCPYCSVDPHMDKK
jgi:hypothetical protein